MSVKADTGNVLKSQLKDEWMDVNPMSNFSWYYCGKVYLVKRNNSVFNFKSRLERFLSG